ncbi:hypothetical protein A2U01_0006182, partial [Trifolium medium]|nr:hypothetical protein [Trifolium medium]
MEDDNNDQNTYLSNNDLYWDYARQRRFERLSAETPFDVMDRYERIASHIRGRTIEEIKQRDLFLYEDHIALGEGAADLAHQPANLPTPPPQ